MVLFAYGSLMGAEGLRELLGERADGLSLRLARLVGWRRIYVEPLEGEAVAAQLYHRRRGNHTGRPAGRYKSVVLQRAYRAGWEVYESFCRDSVDAAGEPLIFG